MKWLRTREAISTIESERLEESRPKVRVLSLADKVNLQLVQRKRIGCREGFLLEEKKHKDFMSTLLYNTNTEKSCRFCLTGELNEFFYTKI